MTVSEALGDRITLALEGTDIRRITIENGARAVATQLDTTDRPQGERWIAGERIIFHVQNEQVTRLDVHGQARSRYVPPPSARIQEGMNEASGDTMTISFAGGQMSRVVLRGGVRGIYWPPADTAGDSTAADTSRAGRAAFDGVEDADEGRSHGD